MRDKILVVHVEWQEGIDPLIDKLLPFAVRVEKDVRVAWNYAYLLPDNYEGHPADAAIKHMKGIKLV